MKRIGLFCLSAALCFLSLSGPTAKTSLEGSRKGVQAGECAKYGPDGTCQVWAVSSLASAKTARLDNGQCAKYGPDGTCQAWALTALDLGRNSKVEPGQCAKYGPDGTCQVWALAQ